MALLRFSGPVVTWRGFKQTSSRRIRTTTVREFDVSSSQLAEQGFPKETTVFIKCKPDAIPTDENLISVEEYGVR